MRTIKNMTQLRDEKKRMKRREKELEEQISKSWIYLKESLQPEMILNKTIQEMAEGRERKNRKEDSILHSTLSFGAGLLGGKLAKMAVEKLGRFIKI